MFNILKKIFVDTFKNKDDGASKESTSSSQPNTSEIPMQDSNVLMRAGIASAPPELVENRTRAMKIIHLAQRHKLPFRLKPSRKIFEATASSQFMVAQEIRRHPGCPIVCEGLYENASNASSLMMSSVAKMIFTKGFPTDFNELTLTQKEFLYDKGAVFTLFYLGEIPSMYKSIHKEISDVIEKQIEDGSSLHMFAPREKEAMDCAKEAAIDFYGKTDNSTVIIVFGGMHDFKPYCDVQRYEHEMIVTDTIISSASLSSEDRFSSVPARASLSENLDEEDTVIFFPPTSLSENRFEVDSNGYSEDQDLCDDFYYGPMESLDQRLEMYPDEISSRLERAEMYMEQNNHSKALEDYAYILERYPTDLEALEGVTRCIASLSSEDRFSSVPRDSLSENLYEGNTVCFFPPLGLSENHYEADTKNSETSKVGQCR